MHQINVVTHSLREIIFTNTHELIKYFVKDGYEVNVIATFVQPEIAFERQIPASSFQYATVNNFGGAPLEHISRGLYERYKAHPRDPDAPIFFPQNYYAKYFVLDEKLNGKSFIDVVDIAWDEISWMAMEHLWFSPEVLLGVVPMFIQKGLFQDIVHTHASNIITPSTVTHKDVLQHYGKNSTIIPFSIKDADFAPSPKTQFSGNVLYFGRIDPRKGLDVLIQELKHLLSQPSIRIDVGGRSNISTRYPEYLRRIKNPRFQFHGECDAHQKGKLFRDADLFIVPSTYDPSPRTVMEAVAEGIPVIASDAVGSAYDLQDLDGVFLFKNADHDDFGRVFDQTIEILEGLSEDGIAEMRARCFDASARFSPETRARELLNLWQASPPTTD